MSGFNTIKKSRKRSHEIEEKLNVLNRELEKTKDIQEITMSTSDLYTPVVTTLPQDPVQVDTPDPDQSSVRQQIIGHNQLVMVKMVGLLDLFRIHFLE